MSAYPQPSLLKMCQVYLAEIENGRKSGFPVETLPVPNVILRKFKVKRFPISKDFMSSIVVLVKGLIEVELCEKKQKRKAIRKARKLKKLKKIQKPKKEDIDSDWEILDMED